MDHVDPEGLEKKDSSDNDQKPEGCTGSIVRSKDCWSASPIFTTPGGAPQDKGNDTDSNRSKWDSWVIEDGSSGDNSVVRSKIYDGPIKEWFGPEKAILTVATMGEGAVALRLAGASTAAKAGIGRLAVGAFSKGGWANRNSILRLGRGWFGTRQAGKEVFRIAVGRNKPFTVFGKSFRIHWHWDIGKWPW